MFKIDDEYIILTENAGFYKFKNGTLSKWSTDLDLNKLTIYSAILSSDNSILIGTIGSGFVKLSSSGNVLEKLNNIFLLSLFINLIGWNKVQERSLKKSKEPRNFP